MTNLTTIPTGTTHIRTSEETCFDGEKRIFTYYHRVTPVTFSDGTKGTKIEYFNYDFGNWQGCVNSYDKILSLINSNDNSITAI